MRCISCGYGRQTSDYSRKGLCFGIIVVDSYDFSWTKKQKNCILRHDSSFPIMRL